MAIDKKPAETDTNTPTMQPPATTPDKVRSVVEHDENPNRLHATLKTTKRIILFSFWIALSGWMVNFDLGYGGTVLQMASFRSTFGHCSEVRNPQTGDTHRACSLSAIEQSIVSLSSL